MMWVKTKDSLPPEGKYVLARHNRGTWNDSTDQKNVNCVVVKLTKGLSIEKRNKLPVEDKRRYSYCAADEWGNNSVGYNWETFGPDSFFGQSITCWCEIPE